MVSIEPGASREEKRQGLRGIIFEALNEQQFPARTNHFPVADYPFESRINQSYWRQTLGAVLAQTEALELLAEMVGIDDREVGNSGY